MTGGIPKRSVIVAGHRTSISVEGPFWAAVMGAAAARQISINDLISEISLWAATQPEAANLSSAVRLWVLARANAAVEQIGQITSPAEPSKIGSEA